MPNQRAASKKNIGGYLDADLKEAIRATGFDETSFVELAIIRGLLSDKRITKVKVRAMAESKRLRDSTVVVLKRDGLI